MATIRDDNRKDEAIDPFHSDSMKRPIAIQIDDSHNVTFTQKFPCQKYLPHSMSCLFLNVIC